MVRGGIPFGKFGAILEFAWHKAMGIGNLQVAGRPAVPLGLSSKVGRLLNGCWKVVAVLVGLGFQLGKFGSILEFKQHKAMGRGNLHTAGR